MTNVFLTCMNVPSITALQNDCSTVLQDNNLKFIYAHVARFIF